MHTSTVNDTYTNAVIRATVGGPWCFAQPAHIIATPLNVTPLQAGATGAPQSAIPHYRQVGSHLRNHNTDVEGTLKYTYSQQLRIAQQLSSMEAVELSLISIPLKFACCWTGSTIIDRFQLAVAGFNVKLTPLPEI
jgi:hypothetical protein